MVTELEMGEATYDAGGRYILRYHKSDKATAALLDITTTDAACWTGFRYHAMQWSFLKFAAKPGMVIGLS